MDEKVGLLYTALREKDRRRLIHRDYDLPADGPVMPKVTVSAPVEPTDHFIADASRAWPAPVVLLSPLQLQSLVKQKADHNEALHSYMIHLIGRIDSGAVSTREGILNADWPA